ncbi:hypothetical protein B0H63DRAFT_443635 [Podospora didyma]|uniref:Lysine-specific metallo-endopeptidase domain-containing protein n=1 Tax=Podospora didyma TaxID=330526 RepID=A0AAE0P4R1_9PEZI|nr:hypothetical protein B0H63DRAFT_443635 [Podospora didyma]
MHSSTIVNLFPLAIFGGGALAAPGSTFASPGGLAQPGETPSELCYTLPNNIPKEVLVSDVQFIASYLRSYGAQIRSGRLFSMAAADTPDCAEWLLYAHGTAQAFAKHIDSTARDLGPSLSDDSILSSVLIDKTLSSPSKMEQHSFLLGRLLTALLVTLLSCAINALTIYDIFTAQPGTTDGACDSRAAVLDDWFTETSCSVVTALEAIDNYEQDIKVRRAVSAIFGISNGKLGKAGARRDGINKITRNLDYVKDFFDQRKTNDGKPLYDRAGYWLFCHSDFLALKQPTDNARDYLGKEMLKTDDKPILIKNVEGYEKPLEVDPEARPWWTKKFTDLDGYYFTEHGGDYCNLNNNLGVTAAIKPYKKDSNGDAKAMGEIASEILCPPSFDTSPKPDSYRDANNLLQPETNLADAIPKSTTLLHETFHALHGNYFLSGEAIYRRRGEHKMQDAGLLYSYYQWFFLVLGRKRVKY